MREQSGIVCRAYAAVDLFMGISSVSKTQGIVCYAGLPAMSSGYSDGERETWGIASHAGLPVMSSGYSDGEKETWGIASHAGFQ